MTTEDTQKRQSRIILYCAGSANVGQLTQQVALELAREGVGRLLCLAGIGARMEGFVRSAREVDETVVLDGCPTGCAKKILEDNSVTVTHYFVMTEQGIKKSYKSAPQAEEVGQALQAVLRSFPAAAGTLFPMADSG